MRQCNCSAWENFKAARAGIQTDAARDLPAPGMDGGLRNVAAIAGGHIDVEETPLPQWYGNPP